MNLDQHLTAKGLEKKQQVQKVMDECHHRFLTENALTGEFPTWILDKIKPLNIAGLSIKGYGSPALSKIESGLVVYELGKKIPEICALLMIHNSIGMEVINELGD